MVKGKYMAKFWDKINPFHKKLSDGVIHANGPRPTQVVRIESVGSSGTDISGGQIDEDYLSDMLGTERADTFDKMRRSDPKVKMCVSAAMNPIKAASWEVEPFDDSDEAKRLAEFAEYSLFEAPDKRWRQLLHEILTFIVHGYSLFERVHKVEFDHPVWGNHITYKTLGYRSQRTIERWNLNDCGELESVDQWAFGDTQSAVVIPAKFLTLFALEREGQNFEGISMLRPCYGPWRIKQSFLKLMAIGVEKNAVPIPVMTVPEGKSDSTEFSAAINVLKSFVSHQQNYVTMPEGWNLDWTKSDFDPAKLQEAIKFQNSEMVFAFLANFLELGQTGSGSYALSFDLSDFFLGGLEHVASTICEVFNEEIIPEPIDLTFGPQTKYPSLKCSGISDKVGKELGGLLKDLSDARYIKPDDRLEEHLRKRIGLPEISLEGQREPAVTGTISRAVTDTKSVSKQFSENVTLGETPRGQITSAAEEARDLMTRNIRILGKDLVDKVMAKYKTLPPSEQINSIKGHTVSGTQAYRNELISFLTLVADDALKKARTEVPAASDVKLATFKDRPPEFERLPTGLQRKITTQADLLVNTQTADLEKAVFFQMSGSIDSTDSAELIEKDLVQAVDDYATGPSVVAGGGNITSITVNSARNAFFFDKEVLTEISAFRFVNPDPVSPICKDLQGRVFGSKDPEADRFRPPLHHNCKSYLVPVLKSKNPNPDLNPRGLKPSDPLLEKYITLSECVCHSHNK
jgi:hypothetical protein